MAVTVTSLKKSLPMSVWAYTVTGLVAGANTVTLPTPPAAGSFPPDDTWVPTEVLVFPYNTGAVSGKVSIDRSTIAETAVGVVSFTLYADGAANALCFVY